MSARTHFRLGLAAAATLVGALAGGLALAIDNGGPIDQAISAGIVGEQADGFLGFVNPPTSVQRDLERRISEVNLRRRAVYADVASRNGDTQERVAVLQALRQITGAANGEYFRDLSGAWCRKGADSRIGTATDGTIQISCR
jgi:uncharacterized protein